MFDYWTTNWRDLNDWDNTDTDWRERTGNCERLVHCDSRNGAQSPFPEVTDRNGTGEVLMFQKIAP